MATNFEDVIFQDSDLISIYPSSKTLNLNQDYNKNSNQDGTKKIEKKRRKNSGSPLPTWKKQKCVSGPLSAQRRRRTALSALFDSNILLPNAKVYYRNGKKGSILASGQLTRDGVKCSCCQNLFTLTKFEAHAGSTYHRPAANILLENGMSLQDCQLRLKSNHDDVTESVKLPETHGTDDKVSGICDTHEEVISDTLSIHDILSEICGSCDDKISDLGSNHYILSKTRGTHDDLILDTGNNDQKLSETSDTHDDMLSDTTSSNHNKLSEVCDIGDDITLDTRNNYNELLEVRNINVNDNICTICCESGELVLCDQCPASFHVSCLGLTMVPEGKLWYCPSCCCRVCGRICKVIDKECVEECTDNNSVVECDQCEKRYHILCAKKDDYMDCTNTEGNWFCNERCEKIFFDLREFLGKQVKLQGHDNLTRTLLQNCDNIAPENQKKLKAALSVMHECFKPSKEYRTGRDINEIIIFNRGSELNLPNLRGFYTVVLEKGGKVTTVALVRVHGEKVAEIPLVATRFKYRKQGQCRILMDEIQKKLTELGVERIVLASEPSVLKMWTKSFGFCQMREAERLNFLGFNFLCFNSTIMCQKFLRKSEDFEHHNCSNGVLNWCKGRKRVLAC